MERHDRKKRRKKGTKIQTMKQQLKIDRMQSTEGGRGRRGRETKDADLLERVPTRRIGQDGDSWEGVWLACVTVMDPALLPTELLVRRVEWAADLSCEGSDAQGITLARG